MTPLELYRKRALPLSALFSILSRRFLGSSLLVGAPLRRLSISDAGQLGFIVAWLSLVGVPCHLLLITRFIATGAASHIALAEALSNLFAVCRVPCEPVLLDMVMGGEFTSKFIFPEKKFSMTGL